MPACVACRMQVPAMSSEALPLATVQMDGVVEAKLTVRPEVAVALSVSCVRAYCVPVMAGKLIVCEFPCTTKLCETSGAGEYALLPACDVKVRLPMRGVKYSLNVATAGGVVLYELLRKYRRSHEERRAAAGHPGLIP